MVTFVWTHHGYYIDESAHLWGLSVAPLNLDANVIALLVINWHNVSGTKPLSCQKNHDIIKGLIFYVGHFLISLPALSLREELMSIYHIWHFHYRGDDGKGTCKGGPHHTPLWLFL